MGVIPTQNPSLSRFEASLWASNQQPILKKTLKAMHVIDQQCNGKNRFKLRIMERG
jgi:hypothetical protein